jgi:hypothetical protein
VCWGQLAEKGVELCDKLWPEVRLGLSLNSLDTLVQPVVARGAARGLSAAILCRCPDCALCKLWRGPEPVAPASSPGGEGGTPRGRLARLARGARRSAALRPVGPANGPWLGVTRTHGARASIHGAGQGVARVV